MPTNPLQRREFEYRVLDSMRCPTFDFEAYADDEQLSRGQSPITNVNQASQAVAYRFLLSVPTLVGERHLAPQTEIGVNLDQPDYPIAAPRTWVISDPVPWSPHFRKGAPVCIGPEFWQRKQGHVTLGHLAQHLARLLNWDEKGRGPGYVGWNGAAIAYHQRTYGGKPLDPCVIYPMVPNWLSGSREDTFTFEVIGADEGTEAIFDFQVHDG